MGSKTAFSPFTYCRKLLDSWRQTSLSNRSQVRKLVAVCKLLMRSPVCLNLFQKHNPQWYCERYVHNRGNQAMNYSLIKPHWSHWKDSHWSIRFWISPEMLQLNWTEHRDLFSLLKDFSWYRNFPLCIQCHRNQWSKSLSGRKGGLFCVWALLLGLGLGCQVLSHCLLTDFDCKTLWCPQSLAIPTQLWL